MNNISTGIFKKAICFISIFLSACGSIESPAPLQTKIPTDLSTGVPVTPMKTPRLQGTDTLTTNHKPLPHPEEYIIYSKYDASVDQEEVWAISPDRLAPSLVTVGMVPRAWSPSNKLWLFTLGGSIYIANADGSGIRAAFNSKEYTGVDPFWLTDNLILFNAYLDVFSPPDIYSLDIDSGKISQLYPEENKFIQATFPSDGTWLRGDWMTGSLDLVHQNGEIEIFFNDFVILADYFNPHQIQRIDLLDKYLIVAKGQGDSDYKFWLLSNNEAPVMIFDPGNESVNFFMVSPDEKYLALTYVTSEGTFINFLSLENQQTVYQWPCPYKIGTCNFTWAPDSQSLALLYSDSNFGVDNGIASGIQIMDVATGETKIILNEDVTQIFDWHFIQ